MLTTAQGGHLPHCRETVCFRWSCRPIQRDDLTPAIHPKQRSTLAEVSLVGDDKNAPAQEPVFLNRSGAPSEMSSPHPRSLNPDMPAVHLNDLLSDGEPKASASLGLRVRAVDLVELLEDASLMIRWNVWPCIGHADVEMAVLCLGCHTYFPGVGELDGVPHEADQHLREALFVAEANRERLVHEHRHVSCNKRRS